jgi:hypothetical protein
VLLKYRDHFKLACDADGCKDPGVDLATTDLIVARRMAIDLGWQERVRRGGVIYRLAVSPPGAHQWPPDENWHDRVKATAKTWRMLDGVPTRVAEIGELFERNRNTPLDELSDEPQGSYQSSERHNRASRFARCLITCAATDPKWM